jgi:predicted transglutaminase-like cysteine proteinase
MNADVRSVHDTSYRLVMRQSERSPNVWVRLAEGQAILAAIALR